MAFSWSEILLYILPILGLAIAYHFRDYLNDGEHIHLVPVDVVQPLLWIGFHFLTRYTFYHSLLAVYIIVVCGLVIWNAYWQVDRKQQIDWAELFRFVSNHSFIVNFILYYIVVVTRLVQVIFF